MRLATLLASIQLSLAPCAGQVTASPPEGTVLPSAHSSDTVASVDVMPFGQTSFSPVHTSPIRKGPIRTGPQQPGSGTTTSPAPTPGSEEDDSSSAAQPVPEPSTLLLVITGLLGLLVSTFWRRRRVEPSQS